MKTLPNVKTFAFSLMLLLVWTGCASVESSNQRSLLSTAGFQVRTPENAKQRELYAAAPANQLQKVTYEGRTFYAYKDEQKGVAYVGDEASFLRYQNLVLQQRIDQAQVQAVEMNRVATREWHNAYGPYAYGVSSPRSAR